MKKQKKSTTLINLLSERGANIADTAIAFYRTARSRHLDLDSLLKEHFTVSTNSPNQIKYNEKS
ncbi:MAG: hypothetical protein WC797_03755 [Candidatus Paceibacterota bacterium]